MSLVIRIGNLNVTRDVDGIRFTIPTPHSTTILTTKETHELTMALVKLFPKKRGGK